MTPCGRCQDDPDCPLGEESVTLCIGAECKHENKWAVVNCADTRQEKGGVFQELVGSEDAGKIAKIGPADKLFHVLLSGSPTKAIDLMAACRAAVSELIASPGGQDADLEITQYLQSIRHIAAAKKKLIIDHYLQMNLGVSLQEFLDTGSKRFLPDHYNQLWGEIRNLDRGADLIFSGFHGSGAGEIESILVRLDRVGETHWERGYSVIGVGMDIALAFLCQRDYDLENMPLMECLFRVAEAKKSAERNRHVGTQTMILIAIQGAGRFRLSADGWEAMKASLAARKAVPFDVKFIEPGD